MRLIYDANGDRVHDYTVGSLAKVSIVSILVETIASLLCTRWINLIYCESLIHTINAMDWTCESIPYMYSVFETEVDAASDSLSF